MSPWEVPFRGVGGAIQRSAARPRAVLSAEGLGRVATCIGSGIAVLAALPSRDEVARALLPLRCRKNLLAAAVPEWEEVVAATSFPAHAGQAACLLPPESFGLSRMAAVHDGTGVPGTGRSRNAATCPLAMARRAA